MALLKEVEVRVNPSSIHDEDKILKKACNKAFFKINDFVAWKINKKSIDARFSQPVYVLRVGFYDEEEKDISLNYNSLTNDAKEVIIVGAGPAGYFAALKLISLGLKPILFERGKDVRLRRRDLKAIQQEGIVDPQSNYCFGEGGAGTYSDGKLYTRSYKRGKISDILKTLVAHGANSDILIDAHPHIGSNKLPQIIAKMRETILAKGGEIYFEHLMTDLIISNGAFKGIVVNGSKEIIAETLILATGHSARDVFKILDKNNIALAFKPFALGVRIEHPQSLIDKIQYRQEKREENLPAASYSLSCQANGRGVFSFCMCPGGLVVPAATAPGEIVVNGMSLSRRDSAFANAGTVTEVGEKHLKKFEQFNAFKGLEFQKQVEQKLFNNGDGSQKAPAQRLTDFVDRKSSSSLSASSYIPGLYSADLHALLPASIYQHLREGIKVFSKKMNGYYTNEANVIGTESRTSSPIKIPRNKDNFMNEQLSGLFPCGEGAGYAGGIVSAALDGQNVAIAVSEFVKSNPQKA